MIFYLSHRELIHFSFDVFCHVTLSYIFHTGIDTSRYIFFRNLWIQLLPFLYGSLCSRQLTINFYEQRFMKSVKLFLKPNQKIKIPFAHFEILQGIVYKLLSHNPQLSAEIHNKKFIETKPFKYFCFTDLMGMHHIENKTLVYDGCFQWEIRSADDRIIDAISSAVKNNPVIEINRQKCDVVFCEVCEKHFLQSDINIKMNTPIVVYKTNKTGFVSYRNPLDREFYDGIIKNFINKYEAFYGKACASEIEIKCKTLSECGKCVTRYKGTIITAWYGEYRISAPPDALDFIYHTGIGGKNSMGFGTISEYEK